jgi:hypothetical protein
MSVKLVALQAYVPLDHLHHHVPLLNLNLLDNYKRVSPKKLCQLIVMTL